MRILLIGNSGTIGSAVESLLKERGHQVIGVSRSSSPALDTADQSSVSAFFRAAQDRGEQFDAVVVTAGGTPFKPLAELTAEDFATAVTNKGIGQIAVVQAATPLIVDGGSITLISGILAEIPVPDGLAASVANAVVDGFVRNAAGALPRGLRINSVSPTVLEESWEAYASAFPGAVPVSGAAVANAFVRSIEGIETGQVIKVW
ncbi:NAD(P)-dependent dehydrogenase (short-subunit alcohol dehydrogenase family) [Psychromicrobium silvestre]|uniref:NAD(P)-dependent dehydrogenase (Short-subunit alcohol dehydrogenase family) n=1 Tax=Psychromicrobium silvestre TaxID=1645614 RepID=A0A7Y9LS03_9MICC|nr:short chain dehydrogenase [Psychromicrobium silvestre]NYE94513.1 NAD(P)-dependent dehydrogenase (short-subunit alcohol dehydrogenase family) [Psychromicrobium silvestre]